MGTPTYKSHWDNYGGSLTTRDWACKNAEEHCNRCGRLMVETIEPTGAFARDTGEPLSARWHSCPEWVTGWRTKKWTRGWALPGLWHESHDADNPLSTRGYH